MHGAIRATGYSVMIVFVSCGVGAQDLASSARISSSATAQEARAIAKEAYFSYIGYLADKDGQPIDASKRSYTLRFDKDALPPAEAFWSLTMYDGKNKLLVANPPNRDPINSRMLPELSMDSDGGLTLYVQHDAPVKELESNWLPAPDGPFFGVLRL